MESDTAVPSVQLPAGLHAVLDPTPAVAADQGRPWGMEWRLRDSVSSDR